MSDVCQITISGRLGHSVNIRTTKEGLKISTFSVATNKSYKDENGDWQEKPIWFKAICFGKRAEYCEKYLFKGQRVVLIGELDIRSYMGRDGLPKNSNEIILSQNPYQADFKPKEDNNDWIEKSNINQNDISKNENELYDDIPF